MRNELRGADVAGLAAGAGAIVCAIFLAGTAAHAADDTTADSLTRLEAETAVLKARARKVEVQAEIAAKQAEIARLALPARHGDPTVRSVEGVGSRNWATLQLANGSTIDVRVGDTLPNGMVVESVGANEVVVRKADRRRYRLGTAGVTPQPGLLPSLPAMPLPPAPRVQR